MITKLCERCKKNRPLVEFFKGDDLRGRRRRVCRDCYEPWLKERAEHYREKHSDKIRERARAYRKKYYEKNKEKIKAKRAEKKAQLSIYQKQYRDRQKVKGEKEK